MRLHRNLTFAVIDSIRDIFNEGVYADKGVEKALQRDKRWGARDRKFVAKPFITLCVGIVYTQKLPK